MILASWTVKPPRKHDVDEDEAVVCRGLVETPFDIETPGFTYIYTLAAA